MTRYIRSVCFVGSGLALATLLVAFPLAAIAAVTFLPIVNSSFEDPMLGNRQFTVGSMPGWTITGVAGGDVGVFNPLVGQQVIDPVPDGEQVGYINSNSVSQVLSANLMANSVYTLDFFVGARNDCCPAEPYEVQLLAGGNVLASVSGSDFLPDPGEFLAATLLFPSTAATPNIGSALEISLTAGRGGSLPFLIRPCSMIFV